MTILVASKKLSSPVRFSKLMKINNWLDITSRIRRHHSEVLNESSLLDVVYLPTEADTCSYSFILGNSHFENLINRQQIGDPVWACSNEPSLIL